MHRGNKKERYKERKWKNACKASPCDIKINVPKAAEERGMRATVDKWGGEANRKLKRRRREIVLTTLLVTSEKRVRCGTAFRGLGKE